MITYIQEKQKLIIASDGSKLAQRLGGAWVIADVVWDEILLGHTPDFEDIS